MSIIDTIISNIAPHDCLGCGYEGDLICVQCVTAFEKIPERCYRCRRFTAQFRVCLPCGSNLEAVYVATAYDGLSKELVGRLKFHGTQAAAAIMAKHMLPLLSRAETTCIVPVPTATSRTRRRGYDQAKLLARQLSRRARLPYVDCLRRSGQTHQVGSSREERLRQLQTAFHVRNYRNITDQHVILADDVVTTGATLEAAAAALKEAGAHKVSAIVFAQPQLKVLKID